MDCDVDSNLASQGLISPRDGRKPPGKERIEDVIAQVRIEDRGGSNKDTEHRAEIFSPPPDPQLVENFTVRPTPSSWFRRFRSVVCCFTPSADEFLYQGSRDRVGESEGEAEVLCPPIPVPTPVSKPCSYVIGPLSAGDAQKKTLVLDLDETLVHSSFQPVEDPDFIVPVDIEGKQVQVYVLKRPWLDHFMEKIGPLFETIVFTASLSKYADPLLDLLDKSEVVRWRLFREACCHYEGNYVKDLNSLGRDLSNTIIVDNSPLSYIFQPANAVAIGAFTGEKDDDELLHLIPLLESLVEVDDVRIPLAKHSDNLHLLSSTGSKELLTHVEVVQ